MLGQAPFDVGTAVKLFNGLWLNGLGRPNSVDIQWGGFVGNGYKRSAGD